MGTLVFTIFDYVREIIDGENTAQEISEVLSIQDINELVEIKGNDNDGYYWGFVDDIDSRLDILIESMRDNPDVVTIEDKDLLKMMIKAELVTQYPDLGGMSFDSGNTYSGTSEEKAEQLLDRLSIEQKISQMLFVNTTDNNSLSKNAGGYILSSGFDYSNARSSIDNASNDFQPVFAVQEEGGSGSTFISGYPDAKTYGDSQNYDKVKQDYSAIAENLKNSGINMNLAPVAEVADENSNIGRRSFGTDYDIVANCVVAAIDGMKEQNILTSLKYFPGYAYTTKNSDDMAVDNRTQDELQIGFNVFERGIDSQVATVTMANVILSEIDDENVATLSSNVISTMRNMGFTGVIMTDNLDDDSKSKMTSIDDRYVQAVLAGNDVLVVNDFDGAKQDILNAYRDGTISETDIDNAVKRVLTMKFEYGIIEAGSVDIEEDNIEAAGTANNFQGAIHLRRVMPDKEIGSMTNVSTGAPVERYTYVTAVDRGLGTKETIPDDVKEKMDGISMNNNSGTSYDDLSYLTIPYFDLNGVERTGHLVVNKELADEVLLIFQELYNLQYPIANMEPIEEYKDRMSSAGIDEQDDSISYGEKLSRTSKYFNNTSAFNDIQDSSHGTGCAIDINPLINPYVDGSTYIPSNANTYTNRLLMLGWTDEEKAAKIDNNSEIYKVFEKYGWTWGASGDGAKDYGHKRTCRPPAAKRRGRRRRRRFPYIRQTGRARGYDRYELRRVRASAQTAQAALGNARGRDRCGVQTHQRHGGRERRDHRHQKSIQADHRRAGRSASPLRRRAAGTFRRSVPRRRRGRADIRSDGQGGAPGRAAHRMRRVRFQRGNVLQPFARAP